MNSYLSILRTGGADVQDEGVTAQPLMPTMAAVHGVGDLAQARSLSEVHAHLNLVIASLGLSSWFLQVEDCRTLGHPQRYTFSNHPLARSGAAEVFGADATPEFAAQVWQLSDALMASGLPPGLPLVWPHGCRCPLGSGFSLVSIKPTSKAILGLARANNPDESPRAFMARQLGNDFAPFVALVHHVILPILARRFVSSQVQSLSDRELECLHWAARGKTASETAMLLHISEHTVNFHIQRVSLKLNASNRSHAVGIAVAMGLVGVHGGVLN
jgi:DNA-binding CsgD family transcriptional regulator